MADFRQRPSRPPEGNGDDPGHHPTSMEVFLIILGAMFISQLLALIVVPIPGEGEELSSMEMKLRMFVLVVTFGLIPLLYLRARRFDMREHLRLTVVPPRSILLLSVPLGLATVLVIDEVDRIMRLIVPFPEEMDTAVRELMAVGGLGEFLLVMVALVVVDVLAQEGVFRGLLQTTLERQVDVTRAVVYTTVAYTAVHLNLVAPGTAVPMFLFGFMLAWLSWRTGSILPAAIAHAINNLLAVWDGNGGLSETLPIYEWNGHVSPLLLVPAVAILVRGVPYLDAFYRSSAPSSFTD